VKQTRQFGYVTDIVRRQFHGDNLVCVGVNPEMQVAPAPRRADTAFLIQPFALAVDLQAGAIDKEMQGLFTTNRLRQDGQIATPTAQRCVIGDCNIELEHIGDRSQQAFGLTQRLVEHQAKCETRLDGCRRIDRLTAALAGAGARHAATASSVNQSVRLPCRTSAASYSGQFVTRYLALGNLWRRLSCNLYGMGFQNYDNGTTGPPYRPDVITAIRSGILRPRRTGQPPGQGDGTSLNLLAIRAPTRIASSPAPPLMSKLYDMQCAADNGGERKLPSFTPPVVPPEFTGKARSLINRVTANAPAVKQAIDRVWQPIE